MTIQDQLDETIAAVAPPDTIAAAAAAERWAGRAKPPGSLGRVEDLAVRVAGITGQVPPAPIVQPTVVVFAGDHGVVADGASAWPSDITAMMVMAMSGGMAAINAFATTVGAGVTIVDVGVATDVSHLPGVVDHKVRPGTASLRVGPAMTREEAIRALLVGVAAAEREIEAGADLLVGGDMGIGNTTPSAALIGWATARVAGISEPTDVADLVGPGAGLAVEQLPHKAEIVTGAVHRALALEGDPVDALAEIGGLEIAALAGFMLAGAAARVPVVIDGVISCAAACVADALSPDVAALFIAGHRSAEPAATTALDHLGLDPVLDLDLRLGEGTGACLAVPIIQASVRALRDMADLPPS